MDADTAVLEANILDADTAGVEANILDTETAGAKEREPPDVVLTCFGRKHRRWNERELIGKLKNINIH